jgi:hypothetical protein
MAAGGQGGRYRGRIGRHSRALGCASPAPHAPSRAHARLRRTVGPGAGCRRRCPPGHCGPRPGSARPEPGQENRPRPTGRFRQSKRPDGPTWRSPTGDAGPRPRGGIFALTTPRRPPDRASGPAAGFAGKVESHPDRAPGRAAALDHTGFRRCPALSGCRPAALACGWQAALAIRQRDSCRGTAGSAAIPNRVEPGPGLRP